MELDDDRRDALSSHRKAAFGAGRRQIEHSSGSLDSGLRVKKAIDPD